MKYRTVTERIGEYLGPVDWSYDFASHGWDREGSFNPELVDGRIEMLRQIEAEPDKWDVTTYGGMPRIWQRLWGVGMYDGWLYWRPVPSFCMFTTFGVEWHLWSSLVEIRRRSE